VILPFGMLRIGNCYQLHHAYSASILPWMAPEVILSKCEISTSANIYSLGILAAQMAYLSVPYKTYEPLELLYHKCKHEHPPLELTKNVSPSLVKFIIACCSFSPEKRETLKNLRNSSFLTRHQEEPEELCNFILNRLMQCRTTHEE
jgi:serine/threonine protein kinase